jgi:hypothetical protein
LKHSALSIVRRLSLMPYLQAGGRAGGTSARYSSGQAHAGGTRPLSAGVERRAALSGACARWLGWEAGRTSRGTGT